MNPVQSSCLISSLPVELLCLIFQFSCRTSALKVQHGHSKWASIMPTVLSQVSRSWREVAIGLTFLWASIHIREGHPFRKTSTWLNRAGNSPLDISILRLRTVADLEGLKYLLLPKVRQWRTFRMLVPETHDLASVLLQRLLGAKQVVPLLEELEIQDIDEEEYGLDMTAFQLHSVILRNVPGGYRVDSIPLGNVSYFKWDSPMRGRIPIHFRDLVYILSLMPTLEILHFGGRMYSPPSRTIEDLNAPFAAPMKTSLPVRLNCLKWLRLEYCGDSCLEPWFFMRCIDAPRLGELYITHAMATRHQDVYQRPLTLSDVDQIFHRETPHTFPSLVKVHWDYAEGYCQQDIVAGYKELGPSLEEIVIHWYHRLDFYGFKDIGRGLTIGNGSLPRLERVRFDDQNGTVVVYVKSLDRLERAPDTVE